MMKMIVCERNNLSIDLRQDSSIFMEDKNLWKISVMVSFFGQEFDAQAVPYTKHE
jgi:hypothetical protein